MRVRSCPDHSVRLPRRSTSAQQAQLDALRLVLGDTCCALDALVVTADDGRTDEASVSLGPGGENRVSIDLGAGASGEDEGAPVGLWLGLGLGGAALVAGAIVAVLVAIAASADPSLQPDPTGVYSVVEALR